MSDHTGHYLFLDILLYLSWVIDTVAVNDNPLFPELKFTQTVYRYFNPFVVRYVRHTDLTVGC